MDAPEKRRWFVPTPAWLVLASLAVTAVLFLSERWRWLPFNEHKGWTVLVAVAGVGVVLVAMLLWFVVALIFRRRFQFSIRLLLVLVVAVALPFGWLATEMSNARHQEEALKGISVVHDWQVSAPGVPCRNAEPPGTAALRQVLGVDFFQRPYYVCVDSDDQMNRITTFYHLPELSMRGVTDASLRELSRFGNLHYLLVSSDGITNAGLQNLGGLASLEHLTLQGANITDDGLQQLKSLTKLKVLSLSHSRITGSGLRYLGGLIHLKELSLSYTPVSDVGLKHVARLSQLEQLDIWSPIVLGIPPDACLPQPTYTSDGLKRLQQELPKCSIN